MILIMILCTSIYIQEIRLYRPSAALWHFDKHQWRRRHLRWRDRKTSEMNKKRKYKKRKPGKAEVQIRCAVPFAMKGRQARGRNTGSKSWWLYLAHLECECTLREGTETDATIRSVIMAGVVKGVQRVLGTISVSWIPF